jgi:uracil-DNA glycosylase
MVHENIRIPVAWKQLLHNEFEKPYWEELATRVREEYTTKKVFPHPTHLFRAFTYSAPQEVNVVILGQDPYHTPGVADGLAFSTPTHNPIPPSLQNIFKEVSDEYQTPINLDPDLSRWATQGVLLLNASLSVRSGEANSHVAFGWHHFTDAVISTLSDTTEHVVYMLWGSFAQKKSERIDAHRHLILTAPHPSPLSAHRGFFGCDHFKKANEYLTHHQKREIVWI